MRSDRRDKTKSCGALFPLQSLQKKQKRKQNLIKWVF